MTEGASARFPEDEDVLDPRLPVGRVFSLDDGGLTPAQAADDVARPPAVPTSVAFSPEQDPPLGGIPAPAVTASAGWDEISPERLRESAADHQARGVFGDTEEAAPMGMAWYEVVLGSLLGMAATLGMYEWFGGGLGPFAVGPAIVLGLILLAIPRHDVRHLGFGLLVSVPASALLGLVLWYAAEWF